MTPASHKRIHGLPIALFLAAIGGLLVVSVFPLFGAPVDQPTGTITSSVRAVSAAGAWYRVLVVDVPLGSYRLKTGLARGRVGATEALADIAKRGGAVAAINGSFFDAYSSHTVRNPYGNLIVGGKVVHISDRITTLVYRRDGSATIQPLKFHISGGLDGKEKHPNNWYAYGVNDLPESANWAEIYTPEWAGAEQTPEAGTQVVICDGRVSQVGSGSCAVPASGFILNLRGSEQYLANRFRPGRRCTFRFTAVTTGGQPVDLTQIDEALGCGPSLLREGRAAPNPEAEGFTDAKILSRACQRSAVGITGDGHLLLVTCRAITMTRLADVMVALGCREAMNLDGGASSGLWLKGKYLTPPGRAISNALLVVEK
ncbi:MAG TPA: phosphodiester glycosidase family protein [Armatimonadota bacterium]